ncbi:hypothetical protein [Shewanella sp.]|uniref:hypothetical protein n=1 Tax=Shewanella sp. TaxID=50422 RepID=UPI004048DBDE
MKKLATAVSIGLAIGVCQQALAQETVEKGKSVVIEIPVDSDTACNIEVTRGGEKTNVSVDPKSKKGVYEFAGRELGEETIRWEGKMKFRGLKTLGPCRGDGSITVTTIEPGSNNATASVESAPAASDSAENPATETASAVTPPQQVQPPPPAASENFQVFSRKGEYGYEMLKKLDGSTVFADPSQLRTDQSFCPITLSQSYDQAGLAAVLSAMPLQLNEVFSSKGVKNNVKFSAVECIRGSGNNLNLGGSAPLVVVQQSAVVQLSGVPGFDRYAPFGVIDGNALMATAKRLADEKAEALAAVASRNDELMRLADQKSKEKIGSITLAYPRGSENLRLCTRKGDETFQLATNGYFATKKLRLSEGYIDAAVEKKSRLNRKSPITTVYENLDDFYLAIQRDPSVCEVYVDYPENLKILADALKEKPYELNTLVPVTELKNDWAVGQGYPDFEMYELTKSIGGDARLAEQLVSFNVTDTQSFNDAVNRMINEGYSQEQSGRTVISFLSDEKTGTETKKSAVAVRDERVRLAEIEEKKRAEKAKAAAAARAAAEAERNKPLQKSRLKPGTTYKWYDDSSCKNTDSEQCLNKNQYQQMCGWAGGLTVNVRRMAAVMFRSPYSQFLAEGGELTNIDYGWNSRIGQCRVSWSIVGMFKGTNVRENFSGYASNFIVTSNGKILIHYVSGR